MDKEKDTPDEEENLLGVSGTLANYSIHYSQYLLVNYQQILDFTSKGFIIISKPSTLTKNTSWLGVPLKIGNQVICSMAIVNYDIPNIFLKTTCRKSDIAARLGGDEFAIILPNTSLADTDSFCQQFNYNCQQSNYKPTYLNPNISMGHALQDGSFSSSEELIQEADKKMYQNKLFNAKSREKHLLNAFLTILAERDPHTQNHSYRMEELAFVLGRKIQLNQYDLNRLRLLALLHDIGKLGIPECILFKSSKLTAEEWDKMKSHCQIGYRIVKNIPDFSSISKEILYHHEK